MPRQPTLLALGAHFDDCVYGIPGTMIKALRRDYRVVVLSMIGDYSNWPPAKGRHNEFVAGAKEICMAYGAEMRFLDFASGRFSPDERTKAAVAQVVADVKPDIAFYLHPHDHHPDHVAASQISRAALHLAGRIVDADSYRAPRSFAYDNGPRHTINFTPDTYIDITDELPDALQWLGQFAALQRNQPFDPAVLQPNQRTKEALSAYRGSACGTHHAEALYSGKPHPQDIL